MVIITRNFKFIVDIIMTFLLLIVMNYNFTGSNIHEILGVLLFIIFVLHNILNIKWYRTLFSGKYNSNRIVQLVVNMLVIVCMILIIISGMMISSTVFYFIHLGSASLGRKVHMLSTYWGFILISVHLGLHHHLSIKKPPKTINTLIVAVICINGIYALIKREIIQNLFLINQYAFFNSGESLILFFTDYLSIMILVIYITSLLREKHRKIKLSIK